MKNCDDLLTVWANIETEAQIYDWFATFFFVNEDVSDIKAVEFLMMKLFIY